MDTCSTIGTFHPITSLLSQSLSAKAASGLFSFASPARYPDEAGRFPGPQWKGLWRWRFARRELDREFLCVRSPRNWSVFHRVCHIQRYLNDWCSLCFWKTACNTRLIFFDGFQYCISGTYDASIVWIFYTALKWTQADDEIPFFNFFIGGKRICLVFYIDTNLIPRNNTAILRWRQNL